MIILGFRIIRIGFFGEFKKVLEPRDSLESVAEGNARLVEGYRGSGSCRGGCSCCGCAGRDGGSGGGWSGECLWLLEIWGSCQRYTVDDERRCWARGDAQWG